MTTTEFSNEFDVLIKDMPINLDEYEKSVLLTEAQEDIVVGLYNGKLTGNSLEETEELRRYLDKLIVTNSPKRVETKTGLSKNSTFFELEEEVLFITYEAATLDIKDLCGNSSFAKVVPIRQDEWHKIKNNPFRRPNNKKVVRLDSGDKTIELISEYPILEYLVRYLRKPNPIILVPLEDDLSINGYKDITECELNTALHRTILERAVEFALRRIPKTNE